MRTLRRFAPGFVSALTLALAGAAWAGDVTYPSLTTATTVQDTDLIATWRASGPLTKVQASVLNAYIQGKLSSTFAQTANNLSDLANAATARTNLGLGSAATQNTGTSGAAVCLMNGNCIWSGTEQFNAAVTVNSTLTVNAGVTVSGGVNVGAKFTTAAPNASAAGFNLPLGSAPTSPANGDVWITSGGAYTYIGGVTFLLQTTAVAAPATTGGSCAVSAASGNQSAGYLRTTATCPSNGTITLSFSSGAPHGWTCVLQDSSDGPVEIRQEIAGQNGCTMIVLGGATGSNDTIQYLAMPY